MRRCLPYIAFAITTFGFGPCAINETTLALNGYTALSPPHNLAVPGAIVVITHDVRDRAQMVLVCGPRASLGADYLPRVSDTVSSAIKLSRSQRLELEANAVERFKSRTSAEDVSSVTVALTNARILEADDSEIFRLIGNRTPECEAAVRAREAAGFAPTMVSSAFIADVTYDVNFRRSAGVEKTFASDQEKMMAIAGKLSGGHTEVSDHEIKAVNLVIGIKTDRFYMGIKACDNHRPPGAGPDRLQAPVAEVAPEPDAPLVPPTGGWANPVRSGKGR